MATTGPVERSKPRHYHSHSAPKSPSSFKNYVAAASPHSPRRNSAHGRPSHEVQADDHITSITQEQPRESRRNSTSGKDHPPTSRADSGKISSGHHHHHHRRHSSHSREMATAVNGGGPAPVVNPEITRPSGSRSGKSRTTIPAASGNWVLGKTIGAGSMGKVKLARRAEGGEQVAVKIVPRGSADDGNNHQSRADRERADYSKEVRTAREAAIVTLLDHPYICGMRDVVRTSYHWYMLFEYVNGGQMLDYIISHGRLKEKQARKFSRQIASALDYCHRNSIVHRDLKIENILISKTGDIKIIDFGLSNLFAPKSHLKTFCGSLYFAAPELLQAKAYTGPEVDLWSFGIVLYVLVCGKVPFDDQNMPALHAKIKKGIVEYPNWLSMECKNLISKMLVTDPKQRATLTEIMNHPWMVKGFGFPPENYLPLREPLKLPLDPNVIHDMTGFDFGAPEVIQAQLTEVLDSQDYIRAVKLATQEREVASQAKDEKKRGFGFDFYKRRNSTSRDTLTNPSSEALHLGSDPTNAFHPLISVYNLVKEKQERDRATVNAGATSMPQAPGEAPLQPDITAPKAVHTNAATYEMPGENVTGGRSRPRARTQGEDEIADAMKHIKVTGSSTPNSPAILDSTVEQLPVRKESTAAGILRRFSTRRRKDPERFEKSDLSSPPLLTVQSPNEHSTLRKSFSVRRTRDRGREQERGDSSFRAGRSQPQHGELLSPPKTADNHEESSNVLGRSTSVNSADLRNRESRRAVTDVLNPPVSYKDPQPEPPTPSNDSDYSTGNEKLPRDETKSKPNFSRRASTTRTKSLGHARREGIQARRARREEAHDTREAGLPGEADAELGGNASGLSTDRIDSAENVKPVFLKGLFTVSTTSTKPVYAIRSDIIRVLKRLGVDFTEIRGGFSCRHTPSIDLKKVVDLPPSSHGNQTPGAKRRISFGGFRGGHSEREREEFREAERFRDPEKYKNPQTPRTPRTPALGTPHAIRASEDANATSIMGRSNSNPNSDASDESVGSPQRTSSSRALGETSTHVQSELGGSMVLEFEIFIVKLPLLSLHGIQFKRLAGGTWQYKSMADQILKELKL